MSIIMVCTKVSPRSTRCKSLHTRYPSLHLNYTNTDTSTSTYTDTYALITDAGSSLGLVLCRLDLRGLARGGGFLSLVGSSDLGSSVVSLFLFPSPFLVLLIVSFVFFLYAQFLLQGSDFFRIGVANVAASMPSWRW